MNADESMAITLDIVSGLIDSEKMIDAVNEGFENSTKGNTTPLKTQIQSFKEAFKDEIVRLFYLADAMDYRNTVCLELSEGGNKKKYKISGFSHTLDVENQLLDILNNV